MFPITAGDSKEKYFLNITRINYKYYTIFSKCSNMAIKINLLINNRTFLMA